jgi:hypothetical protein
LLGACRWSGYIHATNIAGGIDVRGTGRWILGGVVGLVGILGLFLAANAHEVVEYHWIGLGLFVLAALYLFLLVKSSYDRLDRMHAAASREETRNGPGQGAAGAR